MKYKLNQAIQTIKENFGLYLSICFGVFLFILFFQPFPLDRLDFNNRLLFVAGLAAIPFLFLVSVGIAFNRFIQKNRQENTQNIVPAYLSGFILFAVSTIAFTFYLCYVGFVEITFYIIFKAALICLAPPVILRIYDLFRELKQQNLSLKKEKENIQKQVDNYKEDFHNKTIDFFSENQNEILVLPVAEVVLIQSADNYVEIIFRDEGQFKRKLLRNTLRNIEQQVQQFSTFIRCHRTCIVNMHYIEKLHRNYQNQWLSLNGYSEKVPVSRQYLSKLREIL